MAEPHDCEHCGKFHSGYDPHTGYDLSDCPEWNSMTEWEVELSNEGRCPRWVPIEDYQFGDYDPEEWI